MKLILASNSPRRREILTNAGYLFKTVVSGYPEREEKGDPAATAKENALGKAKDVFDKLTEEEKTITAVLGADTVVFIEGKILGKPKDAEDAKNMLRYLSAKTHEVVTGYSLVCARSVATGKSVSEVTFNFLSEELIESYVKSGAPMDKAGAYGIQDGFTIVAGYTGEFENVMGLPIKDIKPLLKNCGIENVAKGAL